MLSKLLLTTAPSSSKFVRSHLLSSASPISGFFLWRSVSGTSKSPTRGESKNVEKLSKHEKNQPSNELDKPKRPINAFMRFFAEFLTKNAQFNRRDGMRPAAVAWKELNADDKQKYEMQYTTEWTKHQADMKKWQEKMIAQGRLEVLQKSLRAKACADIGKPKHPISPFLHFVNSRVKADQPRSVVVKAASDAWKKMTDADKEKYNPNYAAEMRVYSDELRSWKEKMIADGKENVLIAAKKKRKPFKEVKETKSKRINHDDDEGFE